MTPLLHRIGVGLYGPRWQSELARAKGINLRTMQRWVSGRHDGPPSLYEELAEDLDEKAEALKALAAEVRRHIGDNR